MLFKARLLRQSVCPPGDRRQYNLFGVPQVRLWMSAVERAYLTPDDRFASLAEKLANSRGCPICSRLRTPRDSGNVSPP